MGTTKFVLDVYGQLGARALKNVRLACPRGCMKNLVEDEAFWIKQLCVKQLLGFLYNQNLSPTTPPTPQKNNILFINCDIL
jgi:hypothetical protein